MKGFAVFLAVFVLAGAERDWSNIAPLDVNPFQLRGASYNSRIVGGEEAEPHWFPYQAALFINIGSRTAFCGGSLISEEYVLTAAHCAQSAVEIEVVLGAHKIKEDEPTQKRYVSKEFIIHKAWNPLFLTGDLALIKLPEKVQLTPEIQTIRLPRHSDKDDDMVNKPATVSGWGKDSDKATSVSPVLRYVNSTILSPLLCKIFFFGIPGSNHVCLNGKGGKSACSGDSGGPLVIAEEDGEISLQGAVSFGLSFGCQLGWPSVYSKVSAFVPWIHEHTGIPIRE